MLSSPHQVYHYRSSPSCADVFDHVHSTTNQRESGVFTRQSESSAVIGLSILGTEFKCSWRAAVGVGSKEMDEHEKAAKESMPKLEIEWEMTVFIFTAVFLMT